MNSLPALEGDRADATIFFGRGTRRPGSKLQIEPKGARLKIVTAAEFIRRARRYARSNGLDYRFEPARGKGSHGRLWIGGHFTTVRHGELKPGTFRNMLRQLGIAKESF